jgi:starch synthase
VVQGEGERALEQRLLEQATQHPQRIGVRIGYNEARAHLIEAGSDIFLMPSRFEPCGLNQMYSLRYGTVPIARRTGGLADTIVDTNDATLAERRANGFLFDRPDAEALWDTLERALRLYHDAPDAWRQLMRTGMAQDLSWHASAERYQAFYQEAIDVRASEDAALSA